MQTSKIEFRKEREFTTVLSDSFAFLKQNFKSLFLSILLIIGPVILISGLAYSLLQTYLLNNMFSGSLLFSQNYFMYMGLIYLLMIINGVLVNSVVFNYMCLYNEKPAGEKILVSEVGSRVWRSLGRVLGSLAIIIFLFVIVIIVAALIGIGFGSMGAFGIVIAILALVFGGLIYGPILTYFISAAFFVVVRDKVTIFSAFAHTRRYLSGNFWWTWLIMVVALIGLSVLQILFNLPASILSMAETFTRVREASSGNIAGGEHSVLLIVFYTIGRVLTSCSFALLHLVCAFNFLSHEEKHEGQGMLGRIDEIK